MCIVQNNDGFLCKVYGEPFVSPRRVQPSCITLSAIELDTGTQQLESRVKTLMAVLMRYAAMF